MLLGDAVPTDVRRNDVVVGAQCVERGLYETWAPVAELPAIRDVDVTYGAH